MVMQICKTATRQRETKYSTHSAVVGQLCEFRGSRKFSQHSCGSLAIKRKAIDQGVGAAIIHHSLEK